MIINRKNKLKFLVNAIGIICMVVLLSGCSNIYYFKKKIDNFKPVAQENFYIAYNTQVEGGEYVLTKLKDKISSIPLKYSINPYVSYILYFNCKKRFGFYPVFSVKLIHQSNKAQTSDMLVYDATVYSYNTNFFKSVAASVKIISDDLVNMTYPKSKFVKVHMVKKEQKEEKTLQQNISSPSELPIKKHQQHLRYRLYSKEEQYKK